MKNFFKMIIMVAIMIGAVSLIFLNNYNYKDSILNTYDKALNFFRRRYAYK